MYFHPTGEIRLHTTYDTPGLIRKRGRESNDDEDTHAKFPHYADKGWPYCQDTASENSWTRYQLRWQDYPYTPNLVSCGEVVRYGDNIPSDLASITPYIRADFWNLAPWVGPPMVWGRGFGFGIEMMHDPPPYLHKCTLARDFVTQWPAEGWDPLAVGTCGAIIPLVCAYCWARTWRRCDSVPRVGSYISPTNHEAYMSPVLELCDTCGCTSDYNIARCIVLNRFDSVFALLDTGRASVRDIFRCMLAVNRWAAPGSAFGFQTVSDDASKDTYVRLMSAVRTTLQDALVLSYPQLSQHTDVTSIIMMYWQGIDMTPEHPRELTAIIPAFLCDAMFCEHAFPCVPGKKCTWAVEWTSDWAREVHNSHLQLNYRFRDHASAWFPGVDNWKPSTWAEWDAIRAHRCNMIYSDGDHDEGDEGEQEAVEALMERDRARGFVVDYDDEGDDDTRTDDMPTDTTANADADEGEEGDVVHGTNEDVNGAALVPETITNQAEPHSNIMQPTMFGCGD